MDTSAAIHILGILSLVLSVLLQGGAATGQEPIRIFYGASDEREIFNATTITVPSTDSPRLLRLKFVASSAQVRGMENGLFNLPTSFHDVLLTPSTASLTATHLLEVTGSGSITVYGVSAITNNTHYNLTYIVYFDVQSDPTEAPTTTMARTTRESSSTSSSTTSTQDEESTPPVSVPSNAPSISEAKVESSTFISVVVVVVIVALIAYTVTMAALVIYYKNKLKVSKRSVQSQKQESADHDTSPA